MFPMFAMFTVFAIFIMFAVFDIFNVFFRDIQIFSRAKIYFSNEEGKFGDDR